VRSGEPATAQCLIFVTPDGQRTMNTFLGASQFLPAAAMEKPRSRRRACSISKAICGTGRAAPRHAPRHRRRQAAGRKVAFTLAADFVIHRHRDDFWR
jgi:sugar/nucleoside kinase (ribokinase family)